MKKTPAVTNERPESPAASTQPVFKLSFFAFSLDSRSSRASKSGVFCICVPEATRRRLFAVVLSTRTLCHHNHISRSPLLRAPLKHSVY